MKQAMLTKATQAMENAYAPYSHYQVGACIRTTNDKLFAGCNVENISYGLTCCAEASAISNMITEGENSIAEIVIITKTGPLVTPCGACLQRIQEFASQDVPIHLANASGIVKTTTLNTLFPCPFVASHLEE